MAGTPGDCLKNRLDVGWRAGNDSKDLCGRRLLLQRFTERTVLRLQLLEQPDVLDRNDGLVGEGLDQCDVRVGERCYDVAGYEYGPAGDAFMHHRDGENAAIADRRGSRKCVLRILADVWHVDDGTRQDRASAQGTPARRSRISLPHRSESLRIYVVVRRKVQELSIEANHKSVDRVTQPRRIRRDGFKHGLDVAR